MKKIVLLLALISLFQASCFAIRADVWISSNTATADTTKALCNNTFPSSWPHAILHGICVNTGSAGTFTLYNSSASAIQPIAAIDTTAKGCQNYDVQLSSGLTYTNSATANVTVLYQCY